MLPSSYRDCWHEVSRSLHNKSKSRKYLVLLLFKTFQPFQAFIVSKILLDRVLTHCPRFPTAATTSIVRRFPDLMWLTILPDQLKIIDLVGLYPTNNLNPIRACPQSIKNLFKTRIILFLKETKLKTIIIRNYKLLRFCGLISHINTHLFAKIYL